MKILAVDDSVVIRKMINDILTSDGHEVETAENAYRALDIYSRWKPELVTLDIQMPTMNGLKALQEIMSIDKDANVIMLSAAEENALTVECLEKGALGYLPKPFTKEQLINSVNNYTRIKNKKYHIKIFNDSIQGLNKLIKQALDAEAEIVLDNVLIKERESTVNQSTDLSKIREVPEPPAPLNFSIPEGCCGYISKAAKPHKNIILSIVNPQDLEHYKNDEEIIEFFNIFNAKISNSLANLTNTEFIREPTKLYENSDQIIGAEYAVKGKMEIRTPEKTIPIETQIWIEPKD